MQKVNSLPFSAFVSKLILLEESDSKHHSLTEFFKEIHSKQPTPKQLKLTEKLVRDFSEKQFSRVPEILKEPIVNAYDAHVRLNKLDSRIEIQWDTKTSTLKIFDSGDGIDVQRLTCLLLPGKSVNNQAVNTFVAGKFGLGFISLLSLLKIEKRIPRGFHPSKEASYHIPLSESGITFNLVINREKIDNQQIYKSQLDEIQKPLENKIVVHTKTPNGSCLKIRFQGEGIEIYEKTKDSQGTTVKIRSSHLNDSVVQEALECIRFIKMPVYLNDQLFNDQSQYFRVILDNIELIYSFESRIKREVIIAENGRKILSFPTEHQLSLPFLVLNFKKLKLKTERATLDRTDHEIVQSLSRMLSNLFKAEKLETANLNAILYSLCPVIDYFYLRPFLASAALEANCLILPFHPQIYGKVVSRNQHVLFMHANFLREVIGQGAYYSHSDYEIYEFKNPNSPIVYVPIGNKNLFFFDTSLFYIKEISQLAYLKSCMKMYVKNCFLKRNISNKSVDSFFDSRFHYLFPKNLNLRTFDTVETKKEKSWVNILQDKLRYNGYAHLADFSIEQFFKEIDQSAPLNVDKNQDYKINLMNIIREFKEFYVLPDAVSIENDCNSLRKKLEKYQIFGKNGYLNELLLQVASTLEFLKNPSKGSKIESNLPLVKSVYGECAAQQSECSVGRVLHLLAKEMLVVYFRFIKEEKYILTALDLFFNKLQKFMNEKDEENPRFLFLVYLTNQAHQVYEVNSKDVQSIEKSIEGHLSQSWERFCVINSIYTRTSLYYDSLHKAYDKRYKGMISNFEEPRIELSESFSMFIASFELEELLDLKHLVEKTQGFKYITEIYIEVFEFLPFSCYKKLLSFERARLENLLNLIYECKNGIAEPYGNLSINENEGLFDLTDVYIEHFENLFHKYLGKEITTLSCHFYATIAIINLFFDINYQRNEPCSKDTFKKTVARVLSWKDKNPSYFETEEGCNEFVRNCQLFLTDDSSKNPSFQNRVYQFSMNHPLHQDVLNLLYMFDSEEEYLCSQELDLSFPEKLPNHHTLESDPTIIQYLSTAKHANRAIQRCVDQSIDAYTFVFREWLRNSIDAGAKNIHIDFFNGLKIRFSDDGHGMGPDEIQFLIVPNLTKKDTGFGQGFYASLSIFDKIMVVTSKDGVNQTTVYFSKDKEQKVSFSKKIETGSFSIGTVILGEKDEGHQVVTQEVLAKIHDGLKNTLLYLKSPDVWVNGSKANPSAIPVIASTSFYVKNEENQPIEYTISSVKDYKGGIVREDIYLDSFPEEYLSFLPLKMKEILSNQRIQFTLDVASTTQVMNRSKLVQPEEAITLIRCHLLMALLKTLPHLLAEMNKLFPKDFWYDFKRYLNWPEKDFEPIRHFLFHPFVAENELKEVLKVFDTYKRQGYHLSFGTEEELKKHLSYSLDLTNKALGFYYKLLFDDESLVLLLGTIPLKSGGQSLWNLRCKVKEALKKRHIINEAGEYAMEILGKMEQDQVEDHVKQALSIENFDHDYKPALLNFSSRITNEILSCKRFIEKRSEKKPFHNVLERFIKNLYQSVLETEVEVKFYSEDQNVIANSRSDVFCININLCACPTIHFENFYNDVMNNGWNNEALITHMDLIATWLETSIHELEHMRESPKQVTTHTDNFYTNVRTKLSLKLGDLPKIVDCLKDAFARGD